jgi:hypothetical protein
MKRRKRIQTECKNVFTETSILYSPGVSIRGSVICVIKFMILRGSLIIKRSVIFNIELEDFLVIR